jgi:hypothetical protein
MSEQNTSTTSTEDASTTSTVAASTEDASTLGKIEALQISFQQLTSLVASLVVKLEESIQTNKENMAQISQSIYKDKDKDIRDKDKGPYTLEPYSDSYKDKDKGSVLLIDGWYSSEARAMPDPQPGDHLAKDANGQLVKYREICSKLNLMTSPAVESATYKRVYKEIGYLIGLSKSGYKASEPNNQPVEISPDKTIPSELAEVVSGSPEGTPEPSSVASQDGWTSKAGKFYPNLPPSETICTEKQYACWRGLETQLGGDPTRPQNTLGKSTISAEIEKMIAKVEKNKASHSREPRKPPVFILGVDIAN